MQPGRLLGIGLALAFSLPLLVSCGGPAAGQTPLQTDQNVNVVSMPPIGFSPTPVQVEITNAASFPGGGDGGIADTIGISSLPAVRLDTSGCSWRITGLVGTDPALLQGTGYPVAFQYGYNEGIGRYTTYVLFANCN